MKKQLETAMLSAVVVLAAIGAPAQTRDTAPSNRRPRINGTFTDQANGQVVFSGTITLTQFEVKNGVVVAIGTLVGALADSKGDPVGRVNQRAVLPVTHVTSTCDLLRLELGPAEVEILTHPVRLRQDVLGITPRDGAPQTLGPLLCSSATLFDSRPAGAAVAAALNEMLGAMHQPK